MEESPYNIQSIYVIHLLINVNTGNGYTSSNLGTSGWRDLTFFLNFYYSPITAQPSIIWEPMLPVDLTARPINPQTGCPFD